MSHDATSNINTNEVVHEVQLGLNVLEMILKTLMLKKSEGSITLVNLRLKEFP